METKIRDLWKCSLFWKGRVKSQIFKPWKQKWNILSPGFFASGQVDSTLFFSSLASAVCLDGY